MSHSVCFPLFQNRVLPRISRYGKVPERLQKTTSGILAERKQSHQLIAVCFEQKQESLVYALGKYNFLILSDVCEMGIANTEIPVLGRSVSSSADI